MNGVALWIDGQAVMAADGDTILTAARTARLAQAIPTLCHVQGSKPEGGCRLCIVAVSGEERAVAACTTPVCAGMNVDTSAPEIEAERRRILMMLAAAHPLATLEPAQGGREAAHFHGLLKRYGLKPMPQASRGPERTPSSQTHPYLRFDPALCIVCRRCLHVCEDLQGQFVFGIGGRGSEVHLLFGTEEQFSGSPCVSCGACVEVCPTGALFDVDRRTAADAAGTVRSVCGYCGVGCNVEIATDGGTIQRISGAVESAVNAGHLCAKGRYAHGWAHSSERLTHPLLREGGAFRAVTWAHALGWVAERLRSLTGRHGPDAVGLLTSSRSTNEAAYLMQKIFRSQLGTNNVDCCARVCHSSTALALTLATGTGAASASYGDIETARTIVVAGANPTEAHPVVGARIKQAARRGARLIVIDPRRIELSRYATVHLQIEPGTNVALFNAMAKIVLDEDLYDHAYVAARTEGFAELGGFLRDVSMEDAALACGLDVEVIREVARLVAAGPALFVTGLGLSELTQGTDSVLALTNLALLTGSFGRAGAGVLPLRGQNNVQGNADMGSAPTYVTGYQSLTDPAVQRRLLDNWGIVPPAEPGLTIPEMLEAARTGALRGLWIQGEDIVQSDPNEAAVIEALEELELLVVQELFMSETARFAHLVLPAAGVLEQDGTFTNAERRIQRVRRAVKPPGEARPDWEVARDLARALGAAWDYATPADVMAEIARIAPDLFGGVSYHRLDGDGLQWPCPDARHPGTATVHAGQFMRGRGKFSVAPYVPTPERRAADWPYLLITGRVLQHYNVGSMTRRTPSTSLAPGDFVVMHPEDAATEGLENDDRVVVQSRHGRLEAPVRLGDEMRRGTLFLSFHFPETHTNAVTSGLVDSASKCPEYKVTAVRISAVRAGMGGTGGYE